LQSSVIAVGNIVADFIATSVDKFPNWGEHVEVKQPVRPNIGGNAANFSVCLTKLGVPTSLIGKVGKDLLGQHLLDSLRKMGVDVSNVSFSMDPTSVSMIASNLQGERGVIHYVGANESLSDKDVVLEDFPDSEILHLCAYYLLPSLEGESAENLLKKARSFGLTTTFDVAWDVKGHWKIGSLLRFVDFFMPNEIEATMITRKTNPSKSAAAIIEMGAANVVIKLGSRGCLIRTSDGDEMELPAYKVNAVDTTGAGDAFDAGFVYGLHEKWPLKRVCGFANAVAALTLAEPGCSTPSISLSEVMNFLKVN
jgi:sugar/nucleoside kinase (ribokinase family)